MTTPLVIVMDLDETIVGHVSPLVVYWLICTELNKLEDTDIYDPREEIIKCLKDGLLRPHLKEFMDKVRDKFGYVEFFIYTASQDPWTTLLVECIEEIANVSFNRPIFSRDKYCILNYKVLSIIMPYIHNTLSEKYDGVSKEMLYNNLVVIDDKKDCYDDDEDVNKIIVCRKYNYISFVDVLDKIPNEIAERHFGMFCEHIKKFMGVSFTKAEYTIFESFEYKWKQMMNNVKVNGKREDFQIEYQDYWKHFDVYKIQDVLCKV
jgi:hypothetical protein